MERYKEIERSIIKKYRKEIWSKFIKAVKEYELIKENDKVMVCISGGKDSFLLAKCIQELERHGKVPFTAEYIVMNPGYDEIHEKNILENAKTLNVPIKEFKSDIFEVVDKISYDSPCYMCAKMRRGYLYSKAKELGCNKIALGHHFNDVIETTLLSMFYGSEVKTMMPKLHSDNFPGIELIRPLYMVEEASIISWKNSNNLTFINCACKFTERNYNTNDSTSKRKEIKELIKELKKKHTVILSSHILSEVSAVCDYVLIISHGKLVASDTPENLGKLAEGSNTLEMLIKGEKTQIRQALEGIEGVNSVTMEKDEKQNLWSVKVSTEEQNDIREKVFYKMSEINSPIYEMKSRKVSLEEIFLELTASDKPISADEVPNTPEDKDTDAGRSNETNVKQTSAEIPEEQNNDKGGEK